MKSYALRFSFFILCFVFGIGFFWIFNSINKSAEILWSSETLSSIEPEILIGKNQRRGLEVKVKEMIETEIGLAIIFEITNYDKESYAYRAFPVKDRFEPAYPLSELKLDGKKVDEWKCGTGLINYELKPGESKTFRYNISNLSYRWKNEAGFQVGFYFSKGDEKETKLYWSDELMITEPIRKQIIREKKGFQLRGL